MNPHIFLPSYYRLVSNHLSALGETAMSPSTSTDMTDVDMASIAEVELSEKFSVQGTSVGKSNGITKVVSTHCLKLDFILLYTSFVFELISTQPFFTYRPSKTLNS